MENLNDVERLAIAQTLFKLTGELVDTKNPDSLRGCVDEQYRQLYEQTGAKSYDVELNGQDVGTYSIRFSKPKESETQLSFEVYDYFLLAEWFDEIPDDVIRHYVSVDLNQFAEWYFTDTGEMPDGCDIEKIITPATEKQYIGGTLKVDPEKVKSAMGNLFPARIVGLLEG